ncbi:Myosin heavy chain kinase C [Gossypium arboreum]|uniref:Myosin heavy chain kinase C n=1 Tax=Gossypium arboreum TaxID=29729 RepID=A0A0B0NQ22_GOSAR|nr:Myosin heavy chain kinase C [Gossypium arboreum]
MERGIEYNRSVAKDNKGRIDGKITQINVRSGDWINTSSHTIQLNLVAFATWTKNAQIFTHGLAHGCVAWPCDPSQRVTRVWTRAGIRPCASHQMPTRPKARACLLAVRATWPGHTAV